MSFGLFEAIDNEEAAIEIDRATALAFMISKVDERFGDYLRNAQSKKEFDDRWAQVERDVTSVVKESLTPNISTMRKIKGALKPSFDSSAPRAKTAFQKNTWLFSPDLRVYTFEGEKPEFVCPNCSTTKTAMGLSRCSCGTLWNAWSVVEGDKKRFLCREIEDRDTILASAPAKLSTDDTEPLGGIEDEEGSGLQSTSVLKVSREEQEFIDGWNAYPNPRPKMSQAFKEGFEARMFDEEEGS